MDRFELYYNFVHSQLNEQDERVRSYHENARHLMTLSIALLGITGLMVTSFNLNNFDWRSWAFLTGVAASFILSNMFSLRVVFLGLRYIGPHPTELRSNIGISEYEDDALTEWTADTMTEAYRLNEQTLTQKAVNITWAMICFWLEVLFVISLAMSVLLIDNSMGAAT